MDITLRTLTGGEVEGSGVFDELMRTMKSHLQQEFEADRITGTDYANVYLGSTQNVLNSATQFTLQMGVTNKQIELLEEQIAQAKKQNELLELQKAQLEIANNTAQYNLDYILPKQAEQLTNQNAQILKQTNLVEAQITQAGAQTSLTGKQEDLVEEQIEAAKDQHTDPTGGLNKAQFDKTKTEVSVLEQKRLTEVAQTEGTKDTVNGLVGAELTLKNMQAESFQRTAEQNAAKLYADTYSLMYSVNAENMINQEWGLGSDESFAIFKQMFEGLGSSYVPDVDAQ